MQRYVIRDYDVSASSIESIGAVTKHSKGGSVKKHLRRQPSGSDDVSVPSRDNVEMTESDHYDTLEETGVVSPTRRHTSLFDYGLKSD